MENKIFCRWCGHEMTYWAYDENDRHWGQYVCKCGVCAPYGDKADTAEDAKANAERAAMGRPKRLGRPLTLDEVRLAVGLTRLCIPLWLECRIKPSMMPGVYLTSNRMISMYQANTMDSYGIEWRLWSDEPTTDEMATNPWTSKGED